MWNWTKRCFLLLLILIWQFIQFLLFTYRVIFKNDKKMYEIAYAYDVLANTTLNGDRGETLSSRVGFAYLNKRYYATVLLPIIDSLFGKGHCVKMAVKFHHL